MNVLSFGSKAIDTRINHAAHEKLEREVAEFVKNGGEIKQLNRFNVAEKPVTKVNAEHKNDARVVLIRAWLKEKNVSLAEFIRMLNQPAHIVKSRLHGYTKMTGKFFQDALQVVEKFEQEEKRGAV